MTRQDRERIDDCREYADPPEPSSDRLDAMLADKARRIRAHGRCPDCGEKINTWPGGDGCQCEGG
ncbi:MAG: hypothetical protein V2A79_19045 [Planctomycetota bacterium]